MDVRAVIFDLDGTLVDTAPGIEAAVREALAEVLPGVEIPNLRDLIGPPLGEMLKQSLAGRADPVRIQEVIAAFRRRYNERFWKVCRPYPGAADVIRSLRDRGTATFVVTNKPLVPTRLILDHLGFYDQMTAVLSPDSRTPPFRSKAEALGFLVGQYGLDVSSAVLVGDSDEDARAARACGMRFAAATYGYGRISGAGSQADFEIAGLTGLLEMLKGADESPPPPRGRNARGVTQMNREIFDELFVLEIANNHWGKVPRGLRIIDEYSRVVRFNNVRAAMKLQFRDVDHFIHKDFRQRNDIRYVQKTLATQMSKADYATLVEAIRRASCVTMATPFDEASVDLCLELGVQIIKIASSDLNDWMLIEKIATTRKPVMVSVGGSSLKDLDDLVTFFENRNIPLAINHCVSIYPTEDHDLQMNQIDFLKQRYPNHVIGFSTHERADWMSSIMIAYAKGARTFERHIDIEMDGVAVSPYCSLPHQVDTWFKSFKKAKAMCGPPGVQMRIPQTREVEYLNTLVRGVYARTDLKAGHVLSDDDVYLAVPLQKGQISCRELMRGEVVMNDCPKDSPIMIDMIDSPYRNNESLKATIMNRGI
jgi:sialic acid synthase SpsE/phosphoglycolate phosphatase-like HAD superfamily hydrolase